VPGGAEGGLLEGKLQHVLAANVVPLNGHGGFSSSRISASERTGFSNMVWLHRVHLVLNVCDHLYGRERDFRWEKVITRAIDTLFWAKMGYSLSLVLI
jgi:hypothetical protein